jgi:ATP-dependent Lon protease
MSNCSSCLKEYAHGGRCKYTCYKCYKDVCLNCITSNSEEGTGHISCPQCNDIWDEDVLNMYYSAFQIKLLKQMVSNIRNNMYKDAPVGQKRKRDVLNTTIIEPASIAKDTDIGVVDEEEDDKEQEKEEGEEEDDEDELPEHIQSEIQSIVQNLFHPSYNSLRQPPGGFIITNIKQASQLPPSAKYSITKELSNKDIEFFEKLTNDEKDSIDHKYKNIMDNSEDSNTPMLFQIINNKGMNMKVKLNALKMLKSMRSGCSSESQAKSMEWLQGLLKIPFGVERPLPIYMKKDGMESCGQFLEDARKQLDKCIYGMDSVKLQIIQMIGLWLVNPDAASQPIGLCGPAGVGKTSILRNGIAQILGRPFAMIPMGGVSDARLLKGFEMTYIGSQCGQIVNVLQETGVMNPVILFDEVDKLGSKNGADEVAASLIHITDRTSNTDFQDIYYRGISIDISRALLTFSMNDAEAVNPILRNRMHIINVPAYKKKEKAEIIKRHVLPRIEEEFGFSYKLTDDILLWFIEEYDGGEGGVRQIIRAAETLYSRLNLLRMKPDILFDSICKINELNKDIINKIMSLYNDKKEVNESWRHLYT